MLAVLPHNGRCGGGGVRMKYEFHEVEVRYGTKN